MRGVVRVENRVAAEEAVTCECWPKVVLVAAYVHSSHTCLARTGSIREVDPAFMQEVCLVHVDSRGRIVQQIIGGVQPRQISR